MSKKNVENSVNVEKKEKLIAPEGFVFSKSKVKTSTGEIRPLLSGDDVMSLSATEMTPTLAYDAANLNVDLPENVVLVNADTIRLWTANPRFTAHGYKLSDIASKAADNAEKDLYQQFLQRSESGLIPWNPELPALVFEDGPYSGQLKQGNRRYTMYLKYFPGHAIPVRYVKYTETSIIEALDDGNIGIVTKSADEVKLAIVTMFKNNRGWNRSKMIYELWFKARSWLYMVSPTTRTKDNLKDVTSASTGVIQQLYYISTLPQQAIDTYFGEIAAGVSTKERTINKAGIVAGFDAQNRAKAENRDITDDEIFKICAENSKNTALQNTYPATNKEKRLPEEQLELLQKIDARLITFAECVLNKDWNGLIQIAHIIAAK